MYENFDGSSSNQTKGAQNVASWFSIEPVDCVSFADHNECLKHTKIICINGKGSKNNISINSLVSDDNLEIIL